MKKWVLGTIVGGTATTIVGAGLGVPLAIIAAKALQAKHGLEQSASKGGPRVDLKKNFDQKGKLRVVALGDSITAGYNGIMGAAKKEVTTHESYADFLVQSLKNSMGKDNIEYYNFAQNGLRISDISNTLEGGPVSRVLKNADLIPITIGSNDILKYIHLFGIPYGAAPTILGQAQNLWASLDDDTGSGQSSLDTAQDKPIEGSSAPKVSFDPTTTWSRGDNGVLGSFYTGTRNSDDGLNIDKQDSKDMFTNTIRSLSDIADGKTGEYISLDKDYQDKVFNLVKLGIIKLIKQIHDLAPNAQIMLLGPALPFAQFPNDVLNTPNKYNQNEDLLHEFNRLLEAMKEGAKFGIDRPNDFVDFFKADQLPSMQKYSYVDDKGNLKTGPAKINYKDAASFEHSVLNNPMPNITDIHPSIFGHQLIGKDLFSYYGKEFGLTPQSIQADTQKSYPYTDKDPQHQSWLRTDEDPTNVDTIYKGASAMHGLLTGLKLMPKGLMFNVFNGIKGVSVSALSSDPAALQSSTIAAVKAATEKETEKILNDLLDQINKPSLKPGVKLLAPVLNQYIYEIKISELRLNHSNKLSSLETLKNSLMGLGSTFSLITAAEGILNSLNP